MLLHGLNAGDSVRVTYNPMPYLGTGIQEPVVVEGILAEPKVRRGNTYVIVKDAEGKVLLERNVMEISNIGKVGAAAYAMPAKEEPRVARNYNRA